MKSMAIDSNFIAGVKRVGDTVYLLTILSTDGDGGIDTLVFAETRDLQRHLCDIIVKRALPHATKTLKDALIYPLEAKHYDEAIRIFDAYAATENLPFVYAVKATLLM